MMKRMMGVAGITEVSVKTGAMLLFGGWMAKRKMNIQAGRYSRREKYME